MPNTFKEIEKSLPAQARILAVSKLQTGSKVRDLYHLGQRHFGENFVKEARAKQVELQDEKEIVWHLIGHLQKNKVKDVVGHFHMIHSVDSIELAQALNHRAQALGINQKIIIQMNLANEETKGGFSEKSLRANWPAFSQMKNLTLCGLMTMPPLFDNPENTRPYFRKLRELRDELSENCQTLQDLSMGTSADYKVAAEEGATWLRLGTVLFGERPPR